MELLETPDTEMQNTGNTLPQQPTEAIVDAQEESTDIVATIGSETEVAQPDLPTDKATVIARLTEISQLPVIADAAEKAAQLKRIYYTLEHQQQKQAFDTYVAEGGNPEEYIAPLDPDEETIRTLLALIKEKRSDERRQLETQLAENARRKQAIIDELRNMSADTDNVNRHWQRAKELQAEFKEIGDVAQEQATALWKNFTSAVELFYDQWKINKELRDYDFKKNLSEKQLIIGQTQALAEEEDIITAFHRLQDLHQKWRETGPVAKELRDEIWDKFRDASAVVSKRYQAHFEERKAKERANEQAKIQLCEQAETLEFGDSTPAPQWNVLTQQIIELQNQWKQIGPAPRKVNNELYARFRSTADKFFSAKAEYFKNVKDTQAQNLKLKAQLCEQAEALIDSTEWRKTTDRILQLKEEWKKIGPAPRKSSDAIWRRFMDACDKFFTNKKHFHSAKRKEENGNLRVKKQILEQLHQLNDPQQQPDRDEAIARINELRSAWQQTGHVPIKEKDTLAEDYRATVGQLFEKYDIHQTRARIEQFKTEIENTTDTSKLSRERERLFRTLDQRRAELKTYENNLGFLSASSKNASQLIAEMDRKCQRLRDDIADIEKKIKIIDQKQDA